MSEKELPLSEELVSAAGNSLHAYDANLMQRAAVEIKRLLQIEALYEEARSAGEDRRWD